MITNFFDCRIIISKLFIVNNSLNYMWIYLLTNQYANYFIFLLQVIRTLQVCDIEKEIKLLLVFKVIHIFLYLKTYIYTIIVFSCLMNIKI